MRLPREDEVVESLLDQSPSEGQCFVLADDFSKFTNEALPFELKSTKICRPLEGFTIALSLTLRDQRFITLLANPL